MFRIFALATLAALTGCQTTKTISNTTAPKEATVVEVSAQNPVNDRQMSSSFGKKLGRYRDENIATEGKLLLKQLKERKECVLALPESDSGQLSTAEVYRQCQPSALLVGHVYKCGRCDKWHSNAASGVAVAKDVIVTNYHVMDNEKAGSFGAMTKTGHVYPVIEVLAGNEADDVALARVVIPEGAPPLTPAPIVRHAPVGSDVTVISNPTHRFFTCTEGIISRYSIAKRSKKGPEAVRMTITADYAKGSSGAPVFDAAGNVCGLVSATNSIYYNKDEHGNPTNLQMVIKSCVPSAAILNLIASPAL